MKHSIRFEPAKRHASSAVQVLGFGLALLILTVALARHSGAEAAQQQVEVKCAPGEQSFTVGAQVTEITWHITGCSCWPSIGEAKKGIVIWAKTTNIPTSDYRRESLKKGNKSKKYKYYCYSVKTIQKLRSQSGYTPSTNAPVIVIPQ